MLVIHDVLAQRVFYLGPGCLFAEALAKSDKIIMLEFKDYILIVLRGDRFYFTESGGEYGIRLAPFPAHHPIVVCHDITGKQLAAVGRRFIPPVHTLPNVGNYGSRVNYFPTIDESSLDKSKVVLLTR
jgi:hypothetical protein